MLQIYHLSDPENLENQLKEAKEKKEAEELQ
jgi:hypothetical protein